MIHFVALGGKVTALLKYFFDGQAVTFVGREANSLE